VVEGVDVGRVRELNRALVLRDLRRRGRSTRAEIAKQTGLTHATISAIVVDLLEDGWVREVGLETIPRGRPPVLLEIDPRSHFVLGLQLGPHRTRLSLLDSLGAEIASRDVRTRSKRLETVAGHCAELVADLLSSVKVARRRVHAVGVCVPGVVDPVSGAAVDVPGFGWRDEPVGAALSSAIRLPIHVHDDCYALAGLELLEGRAHGERHAVLLSVTGEPAVALIIDGRVHRGASGDAGSLAHFQIPGLTDRCRCGNAGCLGTVVSAESLDRRARGPVRASLDAERMEDVPALALLEAAGRGVPDARAIVDEVAAHLARAVGWVLNLVNPDLLVLGAGLTGLPATMLASFSEDVLAACHPGVRSVLRVERSEFGGPDRARGVALVALHESVEHLESVFPSVAS